MKRIVLTCEHHVGGRSKVGSRAGGMLRVRPELAGAELARGVRRGRAARSAAAADHAPAFKQQQGNLEILVLLKYTSTHSFHPVVTAVV